MADEIDAPEMKKAPSVTTARGFCFWNQRFSGRGANPRIPAVFGISNQPQTRANAGFCYGPSKPVVAGSIPAGQATANNKTQLSILTFWNCICVFLEYGQPGAALKISCCWCFCHGASPVMSCCFSSVSTFSDHLICWIMVPSPWRLPVSSTR